MRPDLFRLATFAGIVGLLLMGCTREAARRNGPASSDTAAASAEHEKPAEPTGQPGVPLEALAHGNENRGADGRIPALRQLHTPLRVERETKENIHVPSRIDTVRTYTYDGLTLTVYAGGGKQIITDLRVTGSGYETADGLHVGSAATAVREARGAPSRTGGGDLVYLIGEAGSTLRFRLQEDQVSAIEWDFYFD